ncbi:hypothetical protein MF672_005310 [Actinomadura sp. ATCC 31491]|uniref:Aminoglycoside phosphotransferase domain-containing protein n=1 Tax=Actinomadura luzonensis TaxID=2805427 RepID=A0ABT0FLK5_9ACTN|nr:hypothetical protein [Actinomadura luzonensis]MCK2213215.1 hypothetical protein [Actinomadura luzonensis]
MNDAAVRLDYLADTVRLLYPGSGAPRAYSVLPHAAVPRRLAPRRWWHVGSPVVVPGEGSIAAHLGEVFGRPVETVLHVRPARRANRKPVLEVRAGGRLLAFVKVGDGDRSRALVAAEAATLGRLAGHGLRTVVVPEVLHFGEWRGLAVLALSPLPVRRRARAPRPLLLAAVSEIAATGPGAAPAWHGDLAPWNLCPAPGGRLLVWDWERYAVGVPYGFDALHHFFHRALRRMPPAEAARALVARAARELAPLGLTAATARQSALRYLIALADRHAADGHEPLGPPQTWLNPAVDHEELLV